MGTGGEVIGLYRNPVPAAVGKDCGYLRWFERYPIFTGLASTHCTSRNEFQHPVSSTSRMHQGTGSGVLPYPQ